MRLRADVFIYLLFSVGLTPRRIIHMFKTLEDLFFDSIFFLFVFALFYWVGRSSSNASYRNGNDLTRNVSKTKKTTKKMWRRQQEKLKEKLE